MSKEEKTKVSEIVEEVATAKVSDASTLTPKNKKMLVIGIAAGVVVVIVAVVLGIIFLGSDSEADEPGSDIPDNYEVYKNDNYKFGYPKDWAVDEASGLTVQPQSQKDKLAESDSEEDFNLDDLEDTVSVQVQELDDDTKQLVLDGKCDEVANGVLGLGEESGGFDLGITPENVKSFKVNGDKACQFEANITFLVEITTKVYAVANDNSAYSITLAGTGGKGDNYKTGEKIQNTFRLEK